MLEYGFRDYDTDRRVNKREFPEDVYSSTFKLNPSTKAECSPLLSSDFVDSITGGNSNPTQESISDIGAIGSRVSSNRTNTASRRNARIGRRNQPNTNVVILPSNTTTNTTNTVVFDSNTGQYYDTATGQYVTPIETYAQQPYYYTPVQTPTTVNTQYPTIDYTQTTIPSATQTYDQYGNVVSIATTTPTVVSQYDQYGYPTTQNYPMTFQYDQYGYPIYDEYAINQRFLSMVQYPGGYPATQDGQVYVGNGKYETPIESLNQDGDVDYGTSPYGDEYIAGWAEDIKTKVSAIKTPWWIAGLALGGLSIFLLKRKK